MNKKCIIYKCLYHEIWNVKYYSILCTMQRFLPIYTTNIALARDPYLSVLAVQTWQCNYSCTRHTYIHLTSFTDAIVVTPFRQNLSIKCKRAYIFKLHVTCHMDQVSNMGSSSFEHTFQISCCQIKSRQSESWTTLILIW